MAVVGLCALACFLNGDPQEGVAQCIDCSSSAMTVLGNHSNNGRGCAACHVPHRRCASGLGTLSQGLWGGGANAECATAIDENGSVSTGAEKQMPISAEISEVVLCLSCHDGNISAENMSVNQSYEEFGGGNHRPRKAMLTMRDSDDWLRSPEHPLGPGAIIEVGRGLQFSSGKFSVASGSPYAQFVANYGWPTLSPTRGRARRFGVTPDGKPYVLCTTCHNQHGTNEYTSSPESPIAADGGGHRYIALYSLNGPYNPDTHNMDGRMATSNVQFCRQCHFELSNEANNAYGIHTLF